MAAVTSPTSPRRKPVPPPQKAPAESYRQRSGETEGRPQDGAPQPDPPGFPVKYDFKDEEWARPSVAGVETSSADRPLPKTPDPPPAPLHGQRYRRRRREDSGPPTA